MDPEGRKKKEAWKNAARARIRANLRKLRLEKGLTVGQMGSLTGTGYEALRNWEKCDRMPDADEFLFILHTMGWKLSDLMKDPEERK